MIHHHCGELWINWKKTFDQCVMQTSQNLPPTPTTKMALWPFDG
jgi:hypothetical protein